MSTDTKIKTLIFNKLTQEQYNNADRVPTEFYLTPDTSIDSSEKGAANGVASLDPNGKVPAEQIPVATASALGGVKPDGTTITVTEDGTISAVGGGGSGDTIGLSIGDVVYSYSSLSSENSGRLPLFTGEIIASANTIYPEFYNWVSSHPELVTTLNLYNQSIEQYGECPKYLIGDDTSNTVGWSFEKNKIIYTTNPNLTITIGSYNSSEGFSEAENYNLLYSNTSNISDSYVQVYIDEELTKPAYLKYVVTSGNTTTTTYRALFIKLFNSKITLYSKYNNDFSIVYDHTDTTVTAGVPLQLDIDSYISLSLESGSIRLPKYSRSHGTVIKEKKPTSTDATWYRQWSDGWLEQGGTIDTVNKTITFLKPFVDTNYTLIGPGFYIANAGNQSVTKTTAGFTTASIANLTAAMYWEAKGQGADGAQEETLYPWVVAYTAAIPTSTAQAAEFQQGLSGKADTNLGNVPSNYDYVVESYNDGTNWYRKYKSGWIEQGGVATSDNVTLLKPMENANYSVYMSQAYNDVDYSAYSAQPHNRTTTSFSYFQYQGKFNAFWYVCGKGAN